MSLRPALSLFLLVLLSASLSGLPDAGYASVPGRRPRNVVLSPHDLTALTSSFGSNTVIQMKWDGLTWVRTEIPVAGKSWGICLLDLDSQYGTMEIVLRAESMDRATSILAVLEIPEGAEWTGNAETPNLAGGRTENGGILVAAWGLHGSEEVDLGTIRLPAGGPESVRLTGGRVLEGGVTGVLSGIEKRVPGTEGFALGRSLPNPFRASTTITFTLEEESEVSLEVFDLHGGLVPSLVHSRLPAAEHEAVWDGRDSGGAPVSAGLYFYRLSNGKASTTRKVVLLD